jgi:hypothetical protein
VCVVEEPITDGVGERGLPDVIVHYEMVTGFKTRYYTFWLTAEGRVADFVSYSD